MSISRLDLKEYLSEFLAVDNIADYCPNGLQIEGKEEIKTIVTGVSACQALIDEGCRLAADAIIVHHGFFWLKEAYPIIGIKKKRIEAIIKNDINLFAYHLPLDIHKIIGNNAQLAERLGIEVISEINQSKPNYGIVGQFRDPISITELNMLINKELDREPLIIISDEKKLIKNVAICTGGAQDYFEYAIEANVDAYISGEISERTTHIAREANVHYVAAGHHATEKFGIIALGEYLAQKFDLDHHFINIENPV